jgi:RNA polymerase sigma-70 factor (ECF subfamily)
LRPELYRYCRHLTRSPWDAEDLAQDTMARAFVTLGCMQEPPAHPRAWLFRVASNLWIDRVRRTRSPSGDATEAASSQEPRASREAAATLIGVLSPQERAAVVLKDVFDLSLEEIGEALSTTVGAVKAALHRGRGKLVAPTIDEPRLPAPGVLDAFCQAFNARDLDRLTALLLDSASIEVVGVHTEYGPDAARKGVYHGMLYGCRHMAEAEAADPAAHPPGTRVLPEPPRAELRMHRGEPLVLLWYNHEDGEKVRGINRLEVDGDRVTRLQNYFFTPDFIGDLCGELGVPHRGNGYSYW